MRARRLAAFLVLALLALAAPAGTAAPPIDADSAIVVNAESGEQLHAVDPDSRHSIASATKLMTALLTLERAEMDETFSAADYAAAPIESKINLRPGERMRVRDLLIALMLESANDAAATLAEGIAGSRARFVRLMNRRARQLGLSGTSYANPIGFDDPSNYSTARDLATLARRLMRDRRFAAIVDLPRAVLVSGARRRVIANRNRLVGRHPFVDGVKTGHTQRAGYVLVGAAHGNGAKVISVVLRAPSESARDADTLALLRWAVRQYHRVRALTARRPLKRVFVEGHEGMRVPLVVRRTVNYTLRRGERLRRRVVAPPVLEGPLRRGARAGVVEVLYLDRIVARVPLVTARTVPAPPEKAFPWAALVLVALAIGGMLVVVRLRKRARRGTPAAGR